MSTTNDSVTMPGERLIGRVKWFNNKAGYGFVTVTDGSQSGTDVFVHHSSIGVSSQQYRYLVQGEYVEFSIVPTQGSSHPFQASNVCGIKGGKLMCETRNETKIARNAYKASSEKSAQQSQPVSEPVKMPRQQKAPKTQPKNDDQKDWTLVKGNKTSQPKESVGGRGPSTDSRAPASGRGRGRPRSTQPAK